MRAILLLPILLLAACSSKSGTGSTSTTTSVTTVTAPTSSVASVQLTWTASSGSPSGYYVMLSEDGTNYNLVQTVSTNSALVGQLTVGRTYFFKVKAYNSGGMSPYSNVFSVTP